MKAGNLNLWMTHYKRMPGTNAIGEPSPTFEPLASFAAGVTPSNARASGDEYFNTGHVLVRIDRQFDIRYSSVKEEDRVLVGGVMYDVLAVADPSITGTDGYQLKCKHTD